MLMGKIRLWKERANIQERREESKGKFSDVDIGTAVEALVLERRKDISIVTEIKEKR